MNKPDGYPYTTVKTAGTEYYPVLVDWSPYGYPQDSEIGNREKDYVDAKRQAVEMAKDHDCNFRVPVHG